MKRLAWVPLIVLGVAACGGPVKDATYENATKLRDAVVASGVDCPGDAVKHDDKYGEDYVKCSSEMSVAVYDNDSDAALVEGLDDFSKTSYLKGQRWLIHATDTAVLGKLKDKLGGSVVVP